MEGDTTSDKEARALLNKFLGATALMTTIENTSGLSKEFLSKGSSSKKQNVSKHKVNCIKNNGIDSMSTIINKQSKQLRNYLLFFISFLH